MPRKRKTENWRQRLSGSGPLFGMTVAVILVMFIVAVSGDFNQAKVSSTTPGTGGPPGTQASLPPQTQNPSPMGSSVVDACTTIGQIFTNPGDGVEMVCVPAGKFMMGSPASDPNAKPSEQPQHEVFLDAFWMEKTEVTNAQYARCVGAGSCRPPGSKGSYSRPSYYDNSQFANYPVITVSWNDAFAYCQWAGLHLPTEAQWEKAARGTDNRLYPWGNASPSGDLLNFNLSLGDTAPVGQYSQGASPYGVLDMAGNVWEWTADWFDDTYYANSPVNNPTGPDSGTVKVQRGGSWDSKSFIVRSTYRVGLGPGARMNFIGFRCAR